MKKTKMTIMALAATFMMVSCGESKKENNADDPGMPMQNEMHQEHSEEMSGNLDDGQTGEVEFNNDNIAEVYNHYSHVKTALVNTNAEEAKNGAQMMAEALQEVDGSEEALQAAQKIAQSDAVNEQRTAFLDLSTAMEDLLTGAIASGEIYKQYCPMAFEGEGGAWLSSSQEVRNPYYGDKMLKCGSVRDTLR